MVLSPAVVFMLCAGESFGGIVFVMLVVLDAIAVAAIVWGLRSFSGAALPGAEAASPWLFYFAPDSGPWALPDRHARICFSRWRGLVRVSHRGKATPALPRRSRSNAPHHLRSSCSVRLGE